MTARPSTSDPTSAPSVVQYSTARVCGDVMSKPRMRLKSVNPLLPPNPVSLRKNSNIAANVSACVMIEK